MWGDAAGGGTDGVQHPRPGVNRHGSAQGLRDRPQLIDPVTMIAVGVGDDYSLELSHSRCEQLLTKVGPAVDEYLTAGALHQDRRAQARIARLCGIAFPPLIADLGDSGRSPAAEDPKLHPPPC